MEKQVLYPGSSLTNRTADFPIIYLAGPISDAPRWHDEAIRILQEFDSEKQFRIASPHVMIDSPAGSQTDYQIEWEIECMQKAREKGCLLFWFPEQETYSRRAYAQTSRLELGEAINEFNRRNFNLAVGCGYNFDGYYYMKYRLDKLEIPVSRKLEDTCKRAVGLL